jgi:hypothetical protein
MAGGFKTQRAVAQIILSGHFEKCTLVDILSKCPAIRQYLDQCFEPQLPSAV